MTLAILGLTAGFILLSAVIAILVIKSPLSLFLKLFVVLALTAFYWIQYASLQRYAGWPLKADLPENFVLLASEVVEPDRGSGEPGRMYWLVREGTDKSVPPRVYELPYVQAVHKQSAEVIEQQKQGSQFIGHQRSRAQGEADLGIEFEKVSKSEIFKKQ